MPRHAPVPLSTTFFQLGLALGLLGLLATIASHHLGFVRELVVREDLHRHLHPAPPDRLIVEDGQAIAMTVSLPFRTNVHPQDPDRTRPTGPAEDFAVMLSLPQLNATQLLGEESSSP